MTLAVDRAVKLQHKQTKVVTHSHKTQKLTAVGSSLAQIICETSQVLLAGGQMVFLGDLPFLPHLTIDLAQNE